MYTQLSGYCTDTDAVTNLARDGKDNSALVKTTLRFKFVTIIISVSVAPSAGAVMLYSDLECVPQCP